jgi:hypothetical protein
MATPSLLGFEASLFTQADALLTERQIPLGIIRGKVNFHTHFFQSAASYPSTYFQQEIFMALETLTLDFHATSFPLGLNLLAAFESSSVDAAEQFFTADSWSAAKKVLDDDDELEDDDDEEADDEDEDGEYEDDDEEVDDEEDEDEYEDDDDEDEDDEEEDDDDDDVDELQVGRRR